MTGQPQEPNSLCLMLPGASIHLQNDKAEPSASLCFVSRTTTLAFLLSVLHLVPVAGSLLSNPVYNNNQFIS